MFFFWINDLFRRRLLLFLYYSLKYQCRKGKEKWWHLSPVQVLQKRIFILRLIHCNDTYCVMSGILCFFLIELPISKKAICYFLTIDFTSFEKFNVEVVQRRVILTVFRLLQNGIFYVVIKTFVCSSFYDTHFEFCNIYLVVLLPTYLH